DDVAPVDDRTDQASERRFTAVGALRRGSEAQAKRRQTELRGELVARSGQVVTLVEDDRPEARPEVLHVQISRIVGRDGERPKVVRPASDDPDLRREGRSEEVVPLA